MRTDEELIKEYLLNHPVTRVKAKRRQSTQKPFTGHCERNIRSRFREVLRDHLLDASENETQATASESEHV